MNIADLFTQENLPVILKWTVTVLIAGFIAQFGKKYADHLIEQARERRARKKSGSMPVQHQPSKLPNEPSPVPSQQPDYPNDAASVKDKQAKKLAKAELKKMKKLEKKREEGQY